MSQWVAFTGQSAYEAAGGGWIRAIQPEDQAEAARAWNEAVRERKALVTQHRLRRRDGEYRHMELRAVPVLDEHGKVREWVGAHTDITDRVKAEEQLGQAQKLQAVGTLAGGVAHEVNNQLMAVLGFGDFVLKELGPEHPQTTDVEEMIRAATRAAQVAQQLLTFSRRQVNQARLLDVHGSGRRAGAGAGAPAGRRQDAGRCCRTARAVRSWPTRPRSTRCSSTSPPTRATRWVPAAGSPSRPTRWCWTSRTAAPTASSTSCRDRTCGSPSPTPAAAWIARRWPRSSSRSSPPSRSAPAPGSGSPRSTAS